GKTLDAIVGNQIYFGIEPPSQRAEWFYLVQGVVYAGDEYVFKRNHASAFSLIILAGGGQFAQRILAVDGHDFVAGRVGSAVQRNGQAKLQGFVSELANLRSQAAGGYGNLSRADAA